MHNVLLITGKVERDEEFLSTQVECSLVGVGVGKLQRCRLHADVSRQRKSEMDSVSLDRSGRMLMRGGSVSIPPSVQIAESGQVGTDAGSSQCVLSPSQRLHLAPVDLEDLDGRTKVGCNTPTNVSFDRKCMMAGKLYR